MLQEEERGEERREATDDVHVASTWLTLGIPFFVHLKADNSRKHMSTTVSNSSQVTAHID